MDTISITTSTRGDETLYTLENKKGMAITLSNRGAALRSCMQDGKELTLGFKAEEDYRRNSTFLAVTVGRFANRIAKGRCRVGDKDLVLDCNNGPNHLHGGIDGFSARLWTAQAVRGTLMSADRGETPVGGVHFSLVSPDGDQGYPGELNASVDIMLSADNQLIFAYRAQTKAETLVNLTNHAYWNLEGEGSGSIHAQTLRLGAAGWLAVDGDSIPTGAFVPMAASPWDFSMDRPLSTVLTSQNAQGTPAIEGIDHNFVIDPKSKALRYELTIDQGIPGTKLSAGTRFAASLKAPLGQEMEVYTDLPGIQVYTGNFLNGQPGRNGPLGLHGGICLETQLFPDSPNQSGTWKKLGKKLGYSPMAYSHWDARLEPGKTWQSMTVHRFLKN